MDNYKLEVEKLIQQEKAAKQEGNTAAQLEILNNLIKIYIDNSQIGELINLLNTNSKFKNQSFDCLLDMIKFSLKECLSKFSHNEEIKFKLFDSVESILELAEIKDPCFEDMKNIFKKHVSSGKYDDACNLINNYDLITIKDPKHKVQSLKEAFQNDFDKGSNYQRIDNINKELNVSSRIEVPLNKGESFKTINLNSSLNMSGKILSQESDHSQNIKLIFNDGLKPNPKSATKLPYVRASVDLTLNPSQIKSIFTKIATDNHYQVINSDVSDCLSAVGSEFSFKRFFFECFRPNNNNSQYNAIRLSIKFAENKFERIIELNSQCGTKQGCESLIKKCLIGFAKKAKRIKIVSKREINLEEVLKQHKKFEDAMVIQYNSIPTSSSSKSANKSKNEINNNFIEKEKEMSLIDNSNKEATSYYEYYKILSQENYDLGRNVSEFANRFIDENKDMERTSEYIPHQMEEVLKFIEECVSTFYCYFNFGKPNTERILPFCRPAVEKFIFNKVYFMISDLYNFKYKKENNAFLEKQNRIKSNLSVYDIMSYLEIKPLFRGVTENSHFIPYRSTIDCINKIQFEISPKDKLDTLMKASLELRNCILDISKGKGELNSMDDELPIFIYICTQVEIKNFFTEISIIDDYLKFSQYIDKESKVLTTLSVSIQFISKWEFQDNSEEIVKKLSF